MKPQLCRMLFLLLSSFSITSISTFNLETRLPMVKLGHPDSYFGYSVAAHQSVNELTGQIEHSWLLVGAPRDDNLQPGTNKSGALWKCPLSTYIDDCDQVITDGRRQASDDRYNDSRIFDVDADKLQPPGSDEIKDDQWLGVTVRSQGPGGKVMVCAHRYISKGVDYQWGRGLCYTLKQVLEYDGVWEPCRGKPVGGAHEEFGFCQAGTSGVIFDDTAIIGTPGPMTWRGTIFVLSVSDDYFNRDKITYMGPVSDLTSPVKKYSYLGMSVTAGHFFGNSTTTYAAGAPRGGSGTGQVVLFTKHAIAGENLLKIQLILDGEQFASSFGYEISTADVNGDGNPDLIVAAPFYFDKNVGGAVYVYMNNENYCLNCSKPVKLTGKAESRFGFAIGNLGDINKDGYEDIAIGAPYEGRGAVYLFLGSSNGLILEPSQVIKAEDIHFSQRSISTFGYSLSGGLDLDQNGYPDLVIGAYEQDLIVLLRSRPIVGLVTSVGPETSLRNIDPNRVGCPENVTSSHTCFSFETCCSVESLVKTSRYDRKLKLRYRLEAETFDLNKRYSRIWFNNSLPNVTNVDERLLHINKGDRKYCQKHVAYLKRGVHDDIQTPIQIKMTYSLVDQQPITTISPGDPLPSLENYPILNQQQADKVFQVTFLNDCGGDICRSQLSVKAQILLPYSDEHKMYELVLGQSYDLVMNISVTNDGESAYEAQLFILFSSSINFGGGKTSLGEACTPEKERDVVVCNLGNPLKNDKYVDASIRFDLTALDETVSDFQLIGFANSTSKEENPEKPLKFPVKVTKKDVLSVKGQSFPESELELEAGAIRGESSINYLEEIGSQIEHSYTIFNDGTWRVTNLEVHIEWPYQLPSDRPDGKWLLYLHEVPLIEDGICSISSDYVNPLRVPSVAVDRPLEYILQKNEPFVKEFSKKNDTASSSGALYNRVRRSTNMVIPAEIYRNGGREEKVVNMNCMLNTAKCINFVCHIHHIPKGQSSKIVIKSRLWNSTLLEDYSNVDIIKIASRAKLRDVLISPSEFLVETVIRVNMLGKGRPESVPLFIVIAAIVVGLLLFILLTLLLWKLGFFKRRRPDPILSGKLEKHPVDEYHDY